MPTPVSSARQCLAGEAAAALDEAVTVARRRCHAQTTSLHIVSALLSIPSSSSSLLRDALSRARSIAYSPRLQFKALELCFSVALDRLPSSSSPGSSTSPSNSQNQCSTPDEPPVSNSLMAAIKRSQANQRRNPESFHIFHHQQQMMQQQQHQAQSPTFAGVKVDLQQLVLSILDDPVVSRVFGEAGFRSCDIKFALLRPPPASILRFPRPARCPPLFLCNFSSTGDEFDSVSSRGFSFPFSRNFLYSDGSDENCRRIGEVLARNKGRNPLLVGHGAADALQDLSGLLVCEKWSTLPKELVGMRFFSVEKDVSEVVVGTRDKAWLEAKIEELGRLLSAVPGVLVSVGDLKGFLDEGGCGEEKRDGVEYLVSELTRMIAGGSKGRMSLVGSSSSYETYMKFLAKFPSVDKDWDLQLLPITSVKTGSPGLSPKPNSLTGSLVPLGGFFPATSNVVMPSCRIFQSVSRCRHCNEKYEEEAAAVVKESSISDEVKDHGTVVSNKVAELQKKWNNVCQHLHRGSDGLMTNTHRSEAFPRIVGFPVLPTNEVVTRERSGCGELFPVAISSEQKTSSPRQSLSNPVASESSKENMLPELELRLSKSVELVTDSVQSHSGDGTSSISLVSVSTDLMLGTTTPPPPCKVLRPTFQEHIPDVGELSWISGSATMPLVPRVSEQFSALSYSSCKIASNDAAAFPKRGIYSSNLSPRFDPMDFKELYKSLVEKVGRQEEAISTISEAITRCRTGNTKRGIWLSFLGPDRIGKKRTAIALAELLFGSKERLIYINLGLQDCSSSPYRICDKEVTAGYSENFRGKIIIDHIVGEISKMPSSVVFLENVDKADFVVQSSLSEAIRTGRFSDSHKREISINNSVFVITARDVRDKACSSPRKERIAYSEERILAAQKWQMKILIESALKPLSIGSNSDMPISLRVSRSEQFSPSSELVFKRKLANADYAKEKSNSSEMAKRAHRSSNKFLDLNVPFDDTTTDDADSSSDESNCTSSDSSPAWLDDFFGAVDEVVVFKPFDFDKLADEISKEISKSFQNTIKSKCKLEIDPKIMEQILAATWLLEGTGALIHWLRKVLTRGFKEAQQRYNLSPHAILRLVACEDVFTVDHAPGILLPSRVGLN